MADAPAPEVPGFGVRARIGDGPCGAVWAARCLTTGATVALRVLPDGVGASAAAGAALRDRVRRLSELADAHVSGPVVSAHLLHVRDLVRAGRRWVLVADLAGGGDLERLLHSGPLDAGRLRTLGVPLARVLEALHARGLAHGGLAPGNVLLSADGRPLLADLGVAELAGAPARPPVLPGLTRSGAAEDRAALAALLSYAGSGVAGPDGVAALPRPLAAVLRRALDPGGEAGWSLAELRGALERAPARPLRPEPLRLTGTTVAASAPTEAPAPADPPRELAELAAVARAAGAVRRGPSRRVVLAALAVSAVAGSGVAAAAVGRAGRPLGPGAADPVAAASHGRAAPPAAPPAPPRAATPAPEAMGAVDWRALVSALEQARDAALAALDDVALTQVETGAALAADRAAVARLRAVGGRPHELHEQVEAVHADWVGPREAVASLVASRSAYVVAAAGGRVLARVGPGGRRAWLLRLERVADRWRVAEVEPAAPR